MVASMVPPLNEAFYWLPRSEPPTFPLLPFPVEEFRRLESALDGLLEAQLFPFGCLRLFACMLESSFCSLMKLFS